MNNAVSLALIASAVALVGAATSHVILKTRHIHLKHTGDAPTGGPQKIHTESTPRIGGVSIWVGLFCAWVISLVASGPGALLSEFTRFFELLLLMATPLFILGLCEDILQTVSVKLRLAFSLIIATVFVVVVDIRIMRLAIPFIDQWLTSLPLLTLLVTAFAISGLIHAMNIVDGLNGLLSGISIAALAAIATVGHQVGDPIIVQIAIMMVAAIAGFAVFNFPGGKLFAGDGGAYLIGFVLAVLVVALTHRHPLISPWFALAVLIHPVWETLFSAGRRALTGRSATQPDAEHFHSLVSRHLITVGKLRGRRVLLGANSGAAIRCVILASIPTLLAVINPYSNAYLMALVGCYVLLYVVAFMYYLRAVSVNAPQVALNDAGW